MTIHKVYKILQLLSPLKTDEMTEYINLIFKPFNVQNTYVPISALLAGAITTVATFSQDYLGISGRFALGLIVVITADFVTGILALRKTKEKATSRKGLRTTYKSGAYFLFIYAAFSLSNELEGRAFLFEEVLKYFHIFLIAHITFWELFSIDENLQKLGLNLGITDALKGTYDTIKTIFTSIGKK